MKQVIEVFLLMENSKIISAYADKAQADEDCWVCNDAEKFSPDPHPFWIKSVPVGSPFEI